MKISTSLEIIEDSKDFWRVIPVAVDFSQAVQSCQSQSPGTRRDTSVANTDQVNKFSEVRFWSPDSWSDQCIAVSVKVDDNGENYVVIESRVNDCSEALPVLCLNQNLRRERQLAKAPVGAIVVVVAAFLVMCVLMVIGVIACYRARRAKDDESDEDGGPSQQREQISERAEEQKAADDNEKQEVNTIKDETL